MIVCHPFEPLAARQLNPVLHTGSLAQCEGHQYILEPVQYYFYHLIQAYMPLISYNFMTGCPYCPMLANTQAGHVSVDIADGPGDNLFGQEQVAPCILTT